MVSLQLLYFSCKLAIDGWFNVAPAQKQKCAKSTKTAQMLLVWQLSFNASI